MKNDIITIKCPFCGAVLKVRTCSGIEDKYVTCPVCKQKLKLSSYVRLPIDESDSIDSIMHDCIVPEDEGCKDDNMRQPRHYIFDIEEPYSISVIPLHEGNLILIKATNEASLKNLLIDKDQLDYIRTRIKELIKDRKYDDIYYLCPKCGNVMKVIYYPHGTGEDLGCECPCCKNIYSFGGTVYLDEITQMTEILPSSRMSARKIFIVKTNRIAENLQSKVYLIDNVRLILKRSDEGWYITHILKLNIHE